MKKLLLIAGLFISGNLMSQKIAEDKIDDFDSIRSVTTNIVALDDVKFIMRGRISKKDHDTAYDFTLYFYSPDAVSIDKDNNLIFKFQDNSIIKLPYAGSWQIFSREEGYSIVVLTDEFIEKVKISPVVKIRIETSKISYDCEISDKKKLLIPKSLDLVMNRIKQ